MLFYKGFVFASYLIQSGQMLGFLVVLFFYYRWGQGDKGYII